MIVNLQKEPTAEEMMKQGYGTIPIGFNILDGTCGNDIKNRFSAMASGTKLYFQFSQGKQRVILDLEPVMQEAYKMAVE
jgi:hypothetical protein